MRKQKIFETPILLIAWKRPDKTKKIIESIKKVKPRYFYVACDGKTENNKILNNQVNLTRKLILENITWDCELKTLFCEYNQGCKNAVSNAISWFFDNVDRGIIIEDDCLPHQDFFYFCSELLKKYENDMRIWSIAGNNLHRKNSTKEESYFFSKYSHCWGWATWRRCWSKYDKDIADWPSYKSKGILNKIFESRREKIFWMKTLDNIYYYSRPNTWDYQWSYTCFINSGLTIIPNENLIYNIGFDDEATHTKFGNPNRSIKNYKRFSSKVFPLKHPQYIHRSINKDKYIDAICYSGPNIFSRKWVVINFKKLLIKIKIILKNLYLIN